MERNNLRVFGRENSRAEERAALTKNCQNRQTGASLGFATVIVEKPGDLGNSQYHILILSKARGDRGMEVMVLTLIHKAGKTPHSTLR